MLRHGHAKRSISAGGNGSPEYRAYINAHTRCTMQAAPYYKNYGGRGIEFRFTNFESFLAEVGNRPTPAHSLDRIDVNGHYESGNVRWATESTQARNRRTVPHSSLHKGVTWKPRIGRWRAYGHLPYGRQKHIGYFDSEAAAALAVEVWRSNNVPVANAT